MSFSKSKTKRFNETTSCAPPVGCYDPQFCEKIPAPIIASGDERFKDLKAGEHNSLTSCNSSSLSSLCPPAMASFTASTPKKTSVKSTSSESLNNNGNPQIEDIQASRLPVLPRKAVVPPSIIPPAEFAKIKDLEKQVRSLVQERNELRKRLEITQEEMSKTESRLLDERTAMGDNMAMCNSRELQELVKCKQTLESELLAVQSCADELKAENQTLKNDYALLQNEKEILRTDFEIASRDASDKVSKLENEVCMAKRKADDSQAYIQELEEKVNEFNISVEISHQEVQQLRKIEQEQSDKIISLTSELQELVKYKETSECELLSIQSYVDELKAANQTSKNDYALLQNEKEILRTDFEIASRDASDKVSKLENEVCMAKRKADDSQAYIQELEEKVNEFNISAEISHQEVQQLRKIEQEQCDKIISLTSELQELAKYKETSECELLSIQSCVDELKAANQTSKNDFALLQKEKEILRTDFEIASRDASDKVSKLENEVCMAKRKADDSQAYIQELEEKVNEFNISAEISHQEVQQLRKIEQEQCDKIISLTSELQELAKYKETSECELLSIQSYVDELKAANQTSKNDYALLQKEKEILRTDFEIASRDASDKVSKLENEVCMAKRTADDSQAYIQELEEKVIEFSVSAEISHQEVQQLRISEQEQCDKIISLTSELQELAKCRETSECRLLTVQSSFDELKAVNQSLKDDYVSLQNEKEILKKDFEIASRDTSDKVNKLENEVCMAKRTADDSQAYIQELEEKINVFSASAEISRQEIQRLMISEQEQRDKIIAMSSELQELAKCKETSECLLVSVGKSKDQLKAENEFLKNNVDMLVSDSNACKDELSAMTCKYADLKKLATQFNAKVTALTKINGELENVLEVRDQDLHVLEADKSELKTVVDRLEKKLSDNKSEKINLETKHAKELAGVTDIVKHKQSMIDTLTDKCRHYESEIEDVRLKLVIEQQKIDVTQITDELRRWRSMYEELWERVQPFQEQLTAFEMEKQILLGKSKNAEHEIESLSREYAKLLGHQNQKQKIHHILKLKEESLALKQEVQSLRDQHLKDKRQIAKLVEKLDALEGKKKFDTSRAFQLTSKENDGTSVFPLKEGNHK